MKQEKTFTDKIIDYICVLSKQPILLRDLLESNRQFNEGMHVEPAKLGFRLKLSRAYLVYIMIVLAILVPTSTLLHYPLANIDPHISILGAMIITAIIFMGFNFFHSKLRDIVSYRQIKKSWQLRFPYFPYNEYNKKIELIYLQSLKEEISKKDLERYILDNLSED